MSFDFTILNAGFVQNSKAIVVEGVVENLQVLILVDLE